MAQINPSQKKQDDIGQLTQLAGLAQTAYSFAGKGKANPNPPAQTPSGDMNVGGTTSQPAAQSGAMLQSSNSSPGAYDPNSVAMQRRQKMYNSGPNVA